MLENSQLPGHALPLPIQKKLKDDGRFIALIRQIVCGYYGLKPVDLERRETDSRQARPASGRVSRAKQIVCYIAKRLCPRMTNERIGFSVGGFNHATVSYSRKIIQNECAVDPKARQQIATLICIVMQRGHELGEFWESVDKEYYFVDLNDVTVLKVSNQQAIVFSGMQRGLVELIKQQFFPQAGAQLRDFKGTGLSIFEKRE